MTLCRLSGEEPIEIAKETQALIAKWNAEITDDNFVPLNDFAYAHASPEWKAYRDARMKMIAEAEAEGTLIG